MKVGIISDIHGNDSALVSVLKKLKKLSISEIYILGDFVGYYYSTDRVFEMLQPFKFRAVRGNHEDLLAAAITSPDTLKEITQKYGTGIEKSLEKLNGETIQYLINLPLTLDIEVDEKSILLSHGTPMSNNEYIYPDSDINLIQNLFKLGKDYLFLGHTHYQMILNESDRYIVNPGSVGQNRKDGSVASFAVLDLINWDLELFNIPYNSTSLLKEIKINDPHNKYLSNVLKRKSKEKSGNT